MALVLDDWGADEVEKKQEVVTRVGAHFTYSREDRQMQPGTESIENSQIQLTESRPSNQLRALPHGRASALCTI